MAIVAVTTTAWLGLAPVSSSAASLSRVFMAPGATGKTCASNDPCGSLADALGQADDGATIVAAAGNYGEQRAGALAKDEAAKSVTVTSASGRDAVFDKTSIDQPGVTFDSVTFRTGVVIDKGPTTVRNVHVINGTLLVRADDTLITDSLVEGGYGRDGINIAGSPGIIKNVTVRRTTVRDIGGPTDDRPQHPDCIQVFDAQHITIEQNNLYNCYNSGLTFSPGARQGISDVLVRANFIQGCISSRADRCGSGASMDLRTIEASNITVTQNTFGTGPVRLPYNPTITATRNIVSYLSVTSPCTTSLSDSLIAGYPTSTCKNGAPGKTANSSSGNSVRKVTFRNPASGNLRSAVSSVVRLAGLRRLSAPATGLGLDIDGQPFRPTTVGADEPNLPDLVVTPTKRSTPSTRPSGTRTSTTSRGPRHRTAPQNGGRTSANNDQPIAIPAGQAGGRAQGAGVVAIALGLAALVVGIVVLWRRRKAGHS